MNAILIVYFVFTAPLLGIALIRGYRSWKPRSPVTTMEKALLEAFDKHGIKATVHELPSSPEEVVIQQTASILSALSTSDERREVWFNHLRASINDTKHDTTAIMQALQAISKAVLEQMNKKPDEKGINDFVHSLEYARDKFADNQSQKKAIEGIIRNVKMVHGTGKQ